MLGDNEHPPERAAFKISAAESRCCCNFLECSDLMTLGQTRLEGEQPVIVQGRGLLGPLLNSLRIPMSTYVTEGDDIEMGF
jgi:hypothetical protein